MYPPNNAGDYQKYGPAPPPSASSQFAQSEVATGIPVPVSATGREVPWSTGLCDCCSDVSSCCLTWCCPCITFGRIAEIVDKGSSSCAVTGGVYALIQLTTGCGFILSCLYRSKMRKQYTLQKSPCADCLVHCCCEPCALCQEYRELQKRGFDMSLGWEGNVARQNPGVATASAPAIQGGMTR